MGRHGNMSQPVTPPVDRRALVAATTTVLLWASAFVAIRSAGHHYAPGALALGRLLTGSATLGVILAIRRQGLPPRRAWPGIVMSGVLWFGGYMVALNWGEQIVDAGTAALVVKVGPILVAVIGGWLLREGFSRRLFLGLAISFTGAAVVGLSTSGGGGASVLGVGLCLVAAASYACGVVGQKPALRHATALQVTGYGCFVGTLCCLPFAGRLWSDATSAPVSATLSVAYLGVLPTAVAFTTWAYALARTSAGRMGATTYAVPTVVVVLSWLLLGEVPGWLTLVGGVVCLAGVAVSRTRRRLGTPTVVSTPSGDPAGGDGHSGGPQRDAVRRGAAGV